MSILFLFLDGFGLGPARDTNPLALAPTPCLHGLVGGPMVDGAAVSRDGVLLTPLDACLGVPGLPQSATGQTALFTGVNAAKHLGYHLPAFPDAALKEIIARRALLKQVVDAGGTATFANAYTTAYFEMVRRGKRRHSVTTLSVYAAGLPFRTERDLLAGSAVYWDMTRQRFPADGSPGVPRIEPAEAGRHLAALASAHDLTVFECFLPDLIGHRGDRGEAARFCRTFDGFLSGILAHLPPACTLVLSSDHGNMEELAGGVHTRNPVPLLAAGPAAGHFATARSITDLVPCVLGALG